MDDMISPKFQRSVLGFAGMNSVCNGYVLSFFSFYSHSSTNSLAFFPLHLTHYVQKLSPGAGNGYVTSTESLSYWFGETQMVLSFSVCLFIYLFFGIEYVPSLYNVLIDQTLQTFQTYCKHVRQQEEIQH